MLCFVCSPVAVTRTLSLQGRQFTSSRVGCYVGKEGEEWRQRSGPHTRAELHRCTYTNERSFTQRSSAGSPSQHHLRMPEAGPAAASPATVEASWQRPNWASGSALLLNAQRHHVQHVYVLHAS